MKSRSRTSHLGCRSLFRTLTLCALALAVALVVTNLPVRGVAPTGVSPNVVISQVYGAGGNSGAVLRNDLVELFNRGGDPVSLSGMSIQYASAAGTGNFGGNPVTTLSGTLQPGQYYLVQLAGGTNGSALPTPDASGTANLSGTTGKVALVNSTTGLACNGGSAPCSPAQLALIVDLVGFGTANFYETAVAPAPSTTTAILRAGRGCSETDNNAADFAAGEPTPRNTASTFHYCSGPTNPSGTGVAAPASVDAGATSLLTVTVTPGTNPPSTGIAVTADLGPVGLASTQMFYDNGTNGDVTAGDNVFSFGVTVPSSAAGGNKSLPFTVIDAQSRSGSGAISLAVVPPPMPIHDIQGPGLESPYVGQFVTTLGVVTARRFNNGFFIQTPDLLVDGDPYTSQGVFVYTGGAPPAEAAVGAYVQVSGTVSEYVADPYAPPMTEIGSPIVIGAAVTYPMPAAIPLIASDLVPTGGLEQLERYEGMRVFVDRLRAVSPTEGSVNETNAAGSSNGLFFGVIDGAARPFREPGVEVPDAGLPAGAPANVPHFDLNPERLRVNSWGQIGSTPIDVTSGALVSNLVGVLDYAYRTWTILPDVSTPPLVSGLVTATPVPVPDANEFTVASFNMERFFDTADDPGVGDVVLTAAAFAKRLSKASLAIRNVLRTPDILGVQEVENITTLQALATRINGDAVAAGDPNPGYAAYLEEGNDPGGIDVGFLVRTARVTDVVVVQEGKTATYIDPSTGLPALLNDRPPLVLTANVTGPTGTLPVTVIVNHLRSLNGIDDPIDGARVRAKRLAQAEFLATLIQARQAADPYERIISVGDYNAFEVNDGYVDVIGSIKGTPTPADQVVLTGADLVNPDLTDLSALAPAADRYSYSYDGNAQLLDHIFVNDAALSRFSRVSFARSNADFPESYRSDATRPERLSDHDMPVAYFVFPGAPVLTLKGSNPMTVEVGDPFVDPGATATDADFGDISAYIEVTGTVDANVVGAYVLTYSVSNWYATSTVTRTVNVVDTTPPVISAVVPTVSFLWPPNHQLEFVGLEYAVTDNSGAATCSAGVRSNEPVNGTGDGDTAPDWLVNGANWVQLRAERAGTGPGRVYTITVTCQDASGNSASQNATVRVPKSMGNGKK